jgi:hypothetical protein
MITTLSAMQQSFAKSRIIGLLLFAAVLLSGCSSLRFAYNSAPELAYWWLDGYFDFTEEQAPQLRERIASWQRWHRTTQLPDYSHLLEQVQRQLPRAVTAEQTCRLVDEASARLDVAVEQALPALADIAVGLTPAQLKHLEQRHAKSNDEYRSEYLQATRKARLEARLKPAVERAQTLYGRLDEAQRERIAANVAGSPFDPERSLAERKSRQADLLQTLRRITAGARANGDGQQDDVRSMLRDLAGRLQRSPHADYARYQQRLKQYNCSVVAEFHNMTTAEQRQAAVLKVKGWEADLRALAAQAR